MKPVTTKDKLALTFVILNPVLILLYTWITAAVFSPFYVGMTAGTWVALIEVAVLLIRKYSATFYTLTISVFALLVTAYTTLIVWIILIWHYMWSNEETPAMFK